MPLEMVDEMANDAPLRFSGDWWLPSAPDQRVNGFLEFNESSGAVLELAEGTLPLSSPEVGEVVQGHRIYGHDLSTGKAVTMLDGWETGSSQHFPSFRKKQTIGGRLLLVGNVHCDADLFYGCTFSLDGLAEWTDRH